MKKQMIFLTLLACVLFGLHGMNEKQVLQVMVGSHTRAFDRKNMYERPFEGEDVHKWNEAIQVVKNFVIENSKKNKNLLLQYMDQIERANDALINDIKIVYGEIRGGAPVENIPQRFSPMFAVIDGDMKKIQNGLEWVGSNAMQENQAIKSVSTLAKFVGFAARKANSNLNLVSN